MDNTSLLGTWIRRFLLEHLVAERNLAGDRILPRAGFDLAKPPFREGNPGAKSSVFSGTVTNPGIEKSAGKR